MFKTHADSDDSVENLSLQYLSGRDSKDSTNTFDFDHLLADDVSEASSMELPAIDGGRGAWKCLLGCWLVEAMIWGFAISFGVFQRYYSLHPSFKDSSSIPTIGTLATGVSYFGMPLANPIAIKWPQQRRTMCTAGWLLCLVSLMAASFATEVWALLVFQGLLYGIGWFICYTPFLFMLNEWWIEKRGLSYGILFASSGVSGLVIPLALNYLLERFGFRIALRVYVIVMIVLSGPGLLLIRPRQTTTRHALVAKKPQIDAVEALRPFLTDIHFLLLAAAVFLQGLGFFIPNIFIPSFAEDIGLSTNSSSGLLALISVSQVLGQFWQGWFSDRINVYIPASTSALASALGGLFLWGPAKTLSQLALFAFLWGFFSASYSVLFTRMVSFLLNGDRRDVAMDERIGKLIYGFFSFERGLSNILEGPISSWLLGDNSDHGDVRQFGLGKYAFIVWFTVLCMLASSLMGVGWLWRGRSHISTFVNS